MYRNCPVRFGRLPPGEVMQFRSQGRAQTECGRRSLSPAECRKEPATGQLLIQYCVSVSEGGKEMGTVQSVWRTCCAKRGDSEQKQGLGAHSMRGQKPQPGLVPGQQQERKTGSGIVRLLAFVIVLCSLLIPIKAQAAGTKASVKKTVYKSTILRAGPKGTYCFELPVITGGVKESVRKRINADVRKVYEDSQKEKDYLLDSAEGWIRTSSSAGASWEINYRYDISYNKNGFISYKYIFDNIYPGAARRIGWTFGMSYSLLTGKRLKLNDVIGGGSFKAARKKVADAVIRSYPDYARGRERRLRKKICSRSKDQIYFYLRNGKVIVSFGGYLSLDGRAEMTVKLQGIYEK